MQRCGKPQHFYVFVRIHACFAGLAATVCAMVIPALAAKVSREKLGNPLFRVWGGNGLIYALFGYAALIAICHVLSTVNRLPVFGR